MLQVFRAHIFFDDQPTHLLAAAKKLLAAQARYSVMGARKAVAIVRTSTDIQEGNGGRRSGVKLKIKIAVRLSRLSHLTSNRVHRVRVVSLI